jgi:hypothetical protein
MSLWPLQLPYGLSEYHRHVQTKGKGILLPYGEYPRWQVLSLQQFSSVAATTSNTLSRLTRRNLRHSSPPRQLTTALTHQTKDFPRREMSASNSAFRRSKTAAATANESRRKTPKSHSRSISAPNKVTKPKRKRKAKDEARPKPLGPGTQPGAHQQMPITIDSGDDSEEDSPSTLSASGVARYVYYCK